MLELPRYRSHKVVQAAKIADISPGELRTGKVNLRLDGDFSVPVSAEWMARHKPQVGWYYVVYDNGAYASASPGDVFEAGYTRIVEESVAEGSER